MADQKIIIYVDPLIDSVPKYIEVDDTAFIGDNHYVYMLQETAGSGPEIAFNVVAPTSPYTLPTSAFKVTGTAGYSVDVYWGDGQYSTVALTGSLVSLVHTYSSSGTYNCTINGDTDQLISVHLYNSPLQIDLNELNSISLEYINVGWINLVSSSNFSFSSGLKGLTINGTSLPSVTGTLAQLPSTLQSITISSSSTNCTTITGALSDLASTSTTYVSLTRLTSITGTMSSFASGLPNVYWLGMYYCTSLTGSISDLGSLPLEYLHLSNMPALTGSIADLPNSIGLLTLTDMTSISGSINSLPTSIETCQLDNCDSLTGNLDGSMSGISWINFQDCDGFDSTTDLYLGPTSTSIIEYLVYNNLQTTLSYSSTGKNWDGLRVMLIPAKTSYGMSVGDLDNLLYDLAYNTSWAAGTKTLNIAGDNPVPSATAQSTYIPAIQALGVTVTYNT